MLRTPLTRSPVLHRLPALVAVGAALALAGVGSASGASTTSGTYASQGTTLRMVTQQAVAEGGVRTARGNRLDVGAPELAQVAALPAADATAGGSGMAGMAMGGAPTVVTGPTGLAREVGGTWRNYAFTVPAAPAAPGTASTPGAIHTVQLSTGKVLVMAGSGNQWQNLQAGKFTTWVWSPGMADQSKAWTLVPTPYDMFCAGHAILPDGDVLIAGGTLAYPQYDAAGNLVQDWQGSKQAYVFDVATSSYVRTAPMANGRWYPTLVSTGDGKQVAVAGLDDRSAALGVPTHNTNTVELYDPAAGTWSALPSMDFTNADPSQKTAAAGTNQTRTFGYYPGLVLLEDGRLFYSGESNGDNGVQPGIWDYRTGAYVNKGPLPQPYQRNAGATVLLPPAQRQKVMVLGGGDYSLPATADTEVIDLKRGATGTWVKGPALSAPKMYVGAVVLPDYTVFETNGAARFREGGVHTAEVYDPATNRFTVMNSPVLDRLYHSEAFLRPDGTVITLGSQPLDGTFQMAISVFSPPYLFRGARPVVRGGVTAFDYSGTPKGRFSISTAAGTTVGKASLVRPSATTHSTDPDQRLVDLAVTKRADGSYGLAAPSNRNLAPPGQYMLFVTDSRGVPSVARWVSIGTGATTPAAPAPALQLTSTMQAYEGRFTATSSIAAAGQDIALQYLQDGVWTYATNLPTDASGVSRMTWGGSGTVQFRAQLAAVGDQPERVSPTLSVTYGP